MDMERCEGRGRDASIGGREQAVGGTEGGLERRGTDREERNRRGEMGGSGKGEWLK